MPTTTEPEAKTLAEINAAIREHTSAPIPTPATRAPAEEWAQFRAGRAEHWARTAELWARVHTAPDLPAWDTAECRLLILAASLLESAANMKRDEWAAAAG